MRPTTAMTLALCFCATASTTLPDATAQTRQPRQAQSMLDDGDGLLIDGTTFGITAGLAKGDPASVIATTGARELGPGAVVFRSRDKLFLIDAHRHLPVVASIGPVDAVLEPDHPRTNRIRIEYVPPETPELQHVHDVLKERRTLETIQTLFSPFRLPIDVTVRVQGCKGVINSWYERENSRPTVTICYEYVQHIMNNAVMDVTPWGITRQDAMCGQFLFVAAHELGHAFFDIFSVPVFGREEDAADQFAAFFILQLEKSETRRLIIGAAYAYMDFIKGYKDNPNVSVPLASFSSNHGAPEERFYNLLCIAYGGRPELFATFVDKGLLPKTRAQVCGYEYRTLRYAVQREIGRHLDWPASRQAWAGTLP